MNVVGEASNWETLISQVPMTNPDLLLVDWGLINQESGATLYKLRMICPRSTSIILISAMDLNEQAAQSAGVDAFISKYEAAHNVADRLREAALL